MKYSITHTNVFKYENMVEQSLNTIRLRPRTNETQRVVAYDIYISPTPLEKEYQDIWRNNIGTFFIAEPHNELIIESKSIVSLQKAPYIFHLHYSDAMREIFHSEMFHEHYYQYLVTSNFTALTDEQLQKVIQEVGPLHESNPVRFACNVMAYLYHTIRYEPGATNVHTTAREAFSLKAGVCQDYTHIMLGILRHFKIPARYISGYLYVEKGDGLIGETATHAWVEIMVPGIGWVGLDPTNNVEVLDKHIIISVGRDYRDVSPVEGVYHGGNHILDVTVNVEKINHA